MSYRLGVLVLHGIGTQTQDFSDGLIAEVGNQLGELAREVCWQPVWWAPVLASREQKMLQDLSPECDRWESLRRFVVSTLGDAVAYQRVPSAGHRKNTYEEIHQIVAQNLHFLRERIVKSQLQQPPMLAEDVPLVVVAHSLGCHIVCNHIWDLQHPTHPRKPHGDNAFERGLTLSGMVTLGCNMPLFTLAYEHLQAIRFPAPDLVHYFKPGTSPTALQEKARWINLYDPDDVLGFPLKPLSADYAKAVSEDRAINVGGLLDSWNPLSHNEYWTDNDVTGTVADLLRGLLQLSR
ncbi:MAG TPA: hypothetical protein VL137_04520 [Polyangiaceae bacterium]|nr:hypothetical protein [Polyangiaceae bacterium]